MGGCGGQGIEEEWAPPFEGSELWDCFSQEVQLPLK